VRGGRREGAGPFESPFEDSGIVVRHMVQCCGSMGMQLKDLVLMMSTVKLKFRETN
jgi:hypothetical protein